jgi:uncharacterized RDD family membrane protein YckC
VNTATAPAAAASGPVAPTAGVTPGLWRRLACFLYEGVLLFGVLMMAGLLYGVLTQQRHALVGATGLQIFLFLVLALYFVVFWTRGGQTLAMLTWHIRLVRVDGRPVKWRRATCRFVLAWLWFMPALLAVHLAGLTRSWEMFGAIFAGVLAYAALTRLHPDRQYWHDAVCGTRLVTALPLHRKKVAKP